MGGNNWLSLGTLWAMTSTLRGMLLSFLTQLPQVLKAVQLPTQQNMWFMHNWAPAVSAIIWCHTCQLHGACSLKMSQHTGWSLAFYYRDCLEFFSVSDILGITGLSYTLKPIHGIFINFCKKWDGVTLKFNKLQS